mgnify:FL=1
MKIKVKVESDLKLEKKGVKFKDKLLDQLSKNSKILLEKNTPKQTGKSSNSYVISKSENQHEITNNTHSLIFVNDGTGIYGARHAPIKPVHAKALHFKWHGKEFFVKSVKGQKPKRFVERSMTEIIRSTESAVAIAKRGTLE